MGFHFHAAFQVEEERYGDALLTACPHRVIKAAGLPGSPRIRMLEPRGALWLELEIKGRKLQVLNTHLGLVPHEQRAQAAALIGPDWIGGRTTGDPPLILLGDFNAPPYAATYRILASRLTDAHRQAGSARATPTRHAEAAFGETAKRKGLALVVDVQDAAARRRGDLGRLRQIVSNLVSNALKFTERGEVRLTLMDHSEDGRDMLHLVVSDTGIGIPAEKIAMLFQKFTQVDSSTTRKFGGTGLGLAICRELAGLMEGRIWVESQEGEGSAFHLVCPLPRAAEAQVMRSGVEATPAEPAGARPLRVLAAEDNATNQLVLRTIMQTFGVDLTLVADGQQAVDAWRGGTFDLILMDIQMPVMDGVAATRMIRETESASGRARTPIVALSANAMTHQVAEYLGAGMDLHVAKPIELAKLHAALRAVTANEPEDGAVDKASGAAA
jgi:CheY-like chemotaxis protein